ncbi:hypothetical protein [Glycomyces buryatensis]|uniref:Nucleotide exchange factor GrpE n=1 Tax=Glycomyces buryatensis TaxID=2570927 RepID=A0A4S8QFG9_9ACTN|nr:hypothetical protein [Glycomyces buryatensis]THV43417.1 hypothetical protein FAB82_01715 [Glycomyces buryatensis]
MTTREIGIGARLRQRRFPAEFRIGPPAPVTAIAEPPMPAMQLPPDPTGLTDRAVAEIVTELWRTSRKIDDAGGEREVPRPQRQANRHLRAAWDHLAEAGIEAQSHEGLRFDVGLNLDVLAYQADPEAVEETVLETIRPSVYRDGRHIQIGQVIVAMPEKERGQADAPRNR